MKGDGRDILSHWVGTHGYPHDPDTLTMAGSGQEGWGKKPGEVGRCIYCRAKAGTAPGLAFLEVES